MLIYAGTSRKRWGYASGKKDLALNPVFLDLGDEGLDKTGIE